MAGLLGGKTQSTAPTRLNGIQVQSSVFGSPVPMGWGTFRASANLLWYGGFKSVAIKQKTGGKGGGSQVTGYNYSASVALGICAGPITGIRTVYKDQTALGSVAAAGLTLFTGALGQAPWSYLSTNFPAQAIGYSGIAYAAASNYALSTSATLPNHSFEVQSATRVSGLDDANPKDIVTQFLGAVPYWQTSWQGDYTGYGNYCLAAGLLLSPVLDSQRAASDFLTEILMASNSDAVWSEGLLKIVPYADTAVTGNGVTFTPDLTPVYSLDDTCFIPKSEGADPVTVAISKDDDAWNYIQVEYLDRAQQYNTQVIPGTDPASIDQWGKRVNSSPYSLHGICDHGVATAVAQLLVQRTANLRRTFQFSLPWNYCLLDPMDLVSINSGDLVDVLVRITEIGEGADGLIAITAEEMLVGTAGPPSITRQTPAGYVGNYEADPGNVSTPVMVNPPLQLTGGENELWIGVAGGANWGGCEVWASWDNATYSPVGVIDAPARYGTTTSGLASGADPDTVNSVGVDLTVSNGTLNGASSTAADNHVTLALVGSEVIAYSAATLVSANHYTLGTYLRRGLMGTTIASQASGSAFLRLDATVFAFPYRADQVGKTVWIKFRSFNSFNQAYQDISTVTAYSVVLTPSAATFTTVDWAHLGDATGTKPENNATLGDNTIRNSLMTDTTRDDWWGGMTRTAGVVANGDPAFFARTIAATGSASGIFNGGALIPVNAAQTLYCSASGRADGLGNNFIRFNPFFYKADGTTFISQAVSDAAPAPDGNWHIVKTTFSVPAGAAYMVFKVFEFVNSGTYIDMAVPRAAATEYLATVGTTSGTDLKSSSGTVQSDAQTFNSFNTLTPGGLFSNGAGGSYSLTLPGVQASFGTTIDNTAITIGSGVLAGIGTTGKVVDNSVVTQGADGTLNNGVATYPLAYDSLPDGSTFKKLPTTEKTRLATVATGATSDIVPVSIGTPAVTIGPGNSFTSPGGGFGPTARGPSVKGGIFAEMDTAGSTPVLMALDDDTTSTDDAHLLFRCTYTASSGSYDIQQNGTTLSSGTGPTGAAKFRETYDEVGFRAWADGTQLGSTVSASPGLTLCAKWIGYNAGTYTGLKSGPFTTNYAGSHVYTGGATVDSLKPAEASATLGAQSGVNFRNSSNVSLGDARVDNSSNTMTTAGVFTNGAGGTYTLDALNVLHGPSEAASDNTANQQVTATWSAAQNGVTINADNSGAIIAGQLAMTLAIPKVTKGGASVAADNLTTYAISGTSASLGSVAVDNTNGSATKGQVTIPAGVTGSGAFILTISYNGKALPALQCQVTVVNAPPSSSGGSGSTSANCSVSDTVSSTSFVQVGSTLTVTVSGGTTIHGTFGATYLCGGLSKSAQAIMKWQYAATGTSFASPTDFGTAVTGSAASTDGDYNQSPGSITCNQNVTPAAATYDVRLVCERSGTALSVSFDPATAYVSVS